MHRRPERGLDRPAPSDRGCCWSPRPSRSLWPSPRVARPEARPRRSTPAASHRRSRRSTRTSRCSSGCAPRSSPPATTRAPSVSSSPSRSPKRSPPPCTPPSRTNPTPGCCADPQAPGRRAPATPSTRRSCWHGCSSMPGTTPRSRSRRCRRRPPATCWRCCAPPARRRASTGTKPGVEPEMLVDDPEALERAAAATEARLAELAARARTRPPGGSSGSWGRRGPSRAVEAALLEEASAYAWVRARLFEGDAWRDLHPGVRRGTRLDHVARAGAHAAGRVRRTCCTASGSRPSSNAASAARSRWRRCSRPGSGRSPTSSGCRSWRPSHRTGSTPASWS
jgi:hypothetical protein